MVEFSFLIPRVVKVASTWENHTSGSDGQNGGILRLIADMSARGEGAAGEGEEELLESVIVPSHQGFLILEV